LRATAPSASCRSTSPSSGSWRWGFTLARNRNRGRVVGGDREEVVDRLDPVDSGLYSQNMMATSTPSASR